MKLLITLILLLSVIVFAQIPVKVVGTADGTNAVIEIDPVSHAVEVVDYSHHEIHEGDHYFIKSYKFLTSSGDSLLFLFNVNDVTTWPHLTWLFDANGASTMKLRETVLDTTGGDPLDTLTTRLTPINSNRNSANTSSHDLFYGQTINGFCIAASLGSVIWSDSTDTAGNKNSPSVTFTSKHSNELILKQDTSYIWEIVAKEDDILIRFDSEWYEHESKQ